MGKFYEAGYIGDSVTIDSVGVVGVFNIIVTALKFILHTKHGGHKTKNIGG